MMHTGIVITGNVSDGPKRETSVLSAYRLALLISESGKATRDFKPTFVWPSRLPDQAGDRTPTEVSEGWPLVFEVSPKHPVMVTQAGIPIEVIEFKAKEAVVGRQGGGTETAAVEGEGRRLRLRCARRESVIRVPACLDKLLPANHLARRVWERVERLDLSEFYVDLQVEEGCPGAPAIDPKILVAIWVYATTQGETSAREVNRLCVEHLAYIGLCGGVAVNYHTLSDFRVESGVALDNLLTQVVQDMAEAGLVEFKVHSQDGMRVRASAGAASFHREATLTKALEEAQAELAARVLAQASTGEAATAREQAAQERATSERLERLEAALAEMPAVKAAKPADERDKARVSSTDAQARVMKMADGGFRPAYNWEFATDAAKLVITGVEVVNIGSDKAQTVPMLEQVKQRYARLPDQWLMDGGFVNLGAIAVADAQHVQVYAPVPEPKDKTRNPYAPLPDDSPAVAAWRQRMGTDEAKLIYKLRAATAECANAQARNSNGVDQVRVRGRAKVRCVALWVALAHNLAIWIKHLQPSAGSATARLVIEAD